MEEEYSCDMPMFRLKIDIVEWQRGCKDGKQDALKGLPMKDCSNEKFKAYAKGYFTRYQEVASSKAKVGD